MGNGQIIVPGTATPADVASGKTFSAGSNYGATGTAVLASGNATAAQVLTGYTASNASGAISGSMPENGAVIVSPGTAQQTIAAGHHNGSGYVKGDANLVAANIKNAVSIFGVLGTLVPGTPCATGTATSTSSTALGFYKDYSNTNTAMNSITVSGLTFTPSKIIAFTNGANGKAITIYDGSESIGYDATTNTVLLSNTNAASDTITTAQKFRTSGSLTVTSTGFTLPVGYGSQSYNWYAYQ